MEFDIDIRDAITTVQREFSHLSGQQLRQATARAINHTAAKAKTEAARVISKRYPHLSAKTAKDTIDIRKAYAGNLTGFVISSGRVLPVRGFKGRQINDGVSVNIAGQRKVIKGAFIRKMKSGHIGVFMRGKYSGREFIRRTTRNKAQISTKNDLPIQELYTLSIPRAFGLKTTTDAIEAVVNDERYGLAARLRHELSRMAGG